MELPYALVNCCQMLMSERKDMFTGRPAGTRELRISAMSSSEKPQACAFLSVLKT